MSSLGIADNTFESVIQDFGFDLARMARETSAFVRARIQRIRSLAAGGGG